LSDLAEHHNEAIAKSAGNPLTSSLPASLPPAFEPPISSPPAASKNFDRRRASASLKRQADRIAAQNIQYKIAFESYVLTILF
jgi:hypothetical protein